MLAEKVIDGDRKPDRQIKDVWTDRGFMHGL